MKIIGLIVISLIFISCTIDRTLSKYQSGDEFNSIAREKEASVKLVNGQELTVKNMSYDGEIFKFDPGDSKIELISVDSVKSIDIYRAKRFMTALKYAGAGLVVSYLSGITAMTIASSDEKIWAERVIGIGYLCTVGFTVKGAVKGVDAHFEIVNWKRE